MQDIAEGQALRVAVLGLARSSWTSRGPSLWMCKEAHGEQLDLAAVYDLDPSQAQTYASEFGFQKVYQDPQALLAEEKLDAVVILPTVRPLAELMGELCAKGLPILLERPPIMDSQYLAGLLDLAVKHNTPNMVAFNRVFIPTVVKAKQWLADNAADRPVRCINARNYRTHNVVKGAAGRMATHPVAIAQDVLGPPVKITSCKAELPSARSGVYAARASYQNDRTAVFVVAPVAGLDVEVYEYLGEDYCISMDMVQCELKIYEDRQLAVYWKAPLESAPAFRGGSLGQTEAFLHAARHGAELKPSLKDAVVTLRTVESILAGGDFDFPD